MKEGTWLQWTSSHQCTSWGWARWNRFADEQKSDPRCSHVFCFFHLFSAPKFSRLLPTTYLPPLTYHLPCHNLSFGLATKAKGVVRLRAKRKEARESKQRHCKSAGQEEARELRQEEARESHHILLGVLESVREYEGVNPHTLKATPTLGSGVPVDS